MSNPCGQCAPVVNCGCASKTEFSCVTYTGRTLDAIGVHAGENGDNVMEAINDRIQDLYSIVDLEEDVSLTSVSKGEDVYIGEDGFGNKLFKGVKAGDGVRLTTTDHDVVVSVDESVKTPVRINNKGNGVPLVEKVSEKEYNIKTLNLGNNSLVVENGENGVAVRINDNYLDGKYGSSINNVENVGTEGTSIGEVEGRTLKLSKIKSRSLNIKEEADGSISIESEATPNTPELYVDNHAVYEGEADGSVLRPYKSYAAARAKVIGNGTPVRPQMWGAKIIYRGSGERVTTDLFINSTRLHFDPHKGQNVEILADNPDDYVIDTEKYYQSAEVVKDANGHPDIALFMYVSGKGGITRVSKGKTGIVRSWGWNRNNVTRSDYTGHINTIVIRFEGDISLTQGIDTVRGVGTGRGRMTTGGGRFYDDIYSYPVNSHMYELGVPELQPLINIAYSSLVTFSIPAFFTGKATIKIIDQTGLRVGGGTYFSYERLVLGMTVSTFGSIKSTDRVFGDLYTPHPHTNFIELVDGGGLYGGNIEGLTGGLHVWTGPNSFVKIKGGRVSQFNVDMKFTEGAAYTKFDLSEFRTTTEDTLKVYNEMGTVSPSYLTTPSKYTVTFPDDRTSSFRFRIADSTVHSNFIANNSNVNVIFDTDGKMGFVQGKPVINPLIKKANDGEVKAEGGVVGTLYFNTINNSLKIVE